MSALRAARCPSALLVLVVLGSLLLTGCLRAETNVEVDGDGSGTVALEVQFDDVSLSETGLSQDNLVKLVETATQSIDGVEVSAASAVGSKGSLQGLDPLRRLPLTHPGPHERPVRRYVHPDLPDLRDQRGC